MKTLQETHMATVEFFSNDTGYAKIKGGPFDQQTVLFFAGGCRKTFPGIISGFRSADMPIEGNEIVLILNEGANPAEPQAKAWGPARYFLQAKKMPAQTATTNGCNGEIPLTQPRRRFVPRGASQQREKSIEEMVADMSPQQILSVLDWATTSTGTHKPANGTTKPAQAPKRYHNSPPSDGKWPFNPNKGWKRRRGVLRTVGIGGA